MSRTPISRKQLERMIEKSAKKVIAETGISPSRSGSKELEHLIKRLAAQPFISLEKASQLGEELGQKIVAFSQAIGKQNLDRGVIRQIIVQKQFPTATGLLTQSLQPNAFQQPSKEVTTLSNRSTQIPQAAVVDSVISEKEIADNEVENQIEDKTQAEAQFTNTVSDAPEDSEEIGAETMTLEAIPKSIGNDNNDVDIDLEADGLEGEDVEPKDNIDNENFETDIFKNENFDIEDGINKSDEYLEIEDRDKDELKEDKEITSLTELEDEEQPLASITELRAEANN